MPVGVSSQNGRAGAVATVLRHDREPAWGYAAVSRETSPHPRSATVHLVERCLTAGGLGEPGRCFT
jgi:hypothetical protein